MAMSYSAATPMSALHCLRKLERLVGIEGKPGGKPKAGRIAEVIAASGPRVWMREVAAGMGTIEPGEPYRDGKGWPCLDVTVKRAAPAREAVLRVTYLENGELVMWEVAAGVQPSM